jgi:hypothetical protein
MKIELRVLVDGRWTRWWTMGVWSADQGRRHSVQNQHDDDGEVLTDTLVLHRAATAVQCRVTLHSDDGENTPTLRGLAVQITPERQSDEADERIVVAPLAVPLLSQMAFEGGEVWCSPVALTMVLHYWYMRQHDERLAAFAAPDAVIRLTVPGVYDPVYDGTGNWAFNTAFAASYSLDAYVARFSTLGALVPWIAAGIPIIASISWEPGKLDNAAVAHSGGHLVVIVGFTEDGDVIVNDPAALSSDEVGIRRVYARDQFAAAWQRKGYGTVYVIYPPREAQATIPYDPS